MNQIALPADDINSVLKQVFSAFGADVAAAVKKNPEFLASIFRDAVTQEIVKKDTLKGVFEKFQKGGLFGGLFGRGGLFSYLGKTLFKKSSTGLTAGVPLGKNLGAESQTEPLTPQTPLKPASDKKEETKEKQFLKGIGKTEPIPILFAGFSGTGSQEITDIFSSLFKTLVKDLLKGIGGIMPEPEEDYGERGVIGTVLENLANLAMLIPGFGLLKGLGRFGKRVTGFGKGGFFRNRKAARYRANRAANRAAGLPAGGRTPPIKTTTSPTPVSAAAKAATTAGKTGAKSGANAITSSAARGASKGLGRSLSRGVGRAVPGLGTALTVGFLASDLASTAEREAKGEITQKEAYTEKGGAIGGAGGALGGAALGAAIGTAAIPIPVVGTLIGALAGGIIGGIGGQMGGEAIGSSMAPEETLPITPTSDIKDLDIPEPTDYTQTLNTISTNTGTTVDKISRLSDAIFMLANTFKTQGSNQGTNNIFINGQQQKEVASASQVSESNFNAIGRIRQQFAV